MLCLQVLLALFFATAIAADDYYSIWPKKIQDDATNQDIARKLGHRLGDKLSFTSTCELGYMFWYAELSGDDLKFVKGLKGVRAVAIPNSQNLGLETTPKNKRRRIERRASRTSQKGAPDHLKFVSQPSGSPYGSVGKEAGYNYFDSAGEGTRVYIVDSGLAADHEEFNEVQGDIGWIYGRPDSQAAENDFDDHASHGTCMASCAVGHKDGVAKKASLTAVRVYREDDLAFERLIDALAQVYDDIIKRKLQGKAVISMSIGQPPITTDKYKDYMAAVEDTMAALTNGVIDGLDGAVVVAAGQDYPLSPDNQPVQLPATLAEQKCPKMIIVGGVDLTGAVADGTLEYKAGTTIDNMIWGPAEDVHCAKQGGYIDDLTGTSPATAITAGLIAYFMGDGNTGEDARKLIFEYAYVRTPKSERLKRGMRNAISNGVECS